jgi:hypothetical protein
LAFHNRASHQKKKALWAEIAEKMKPKKRVSQVAQVFSKFVENHFPSGLHWSAPLRRVKPPQKNSTEDSKPFFTAIRGAPLLFAADCPP